ncbi:MAG: TonB-dependent receptor plug domain-containing protein [Acidobacteria bacterium]|nr:TonB-dependent receptor plug domain-containing protein [Acidobacteriota bacterium]
MHLLGNRISALAAAAFLLCPAAGPAQSGSVPQTGTDDKIYEMEEITVTEVPYVNPDVRPVTPVTTRYGTQRNLVTQDQIGQQEPLDFQSVLRNVPGVMFQSKNLAGSQSSHSVYIRGRGASHPSSDFAVEFDGVPRFGALYGQVLGDGTAVSTIGGVEVFKSPQPSQFGSGYASINILPRTMTQEGWTSGLDLGGGNFSTVDQALTGGYRDGPFDIFLSQSWTSTDGHVEHSRAQQQGYYANTGFRLSEEWELRFVASYANAQTLAPMPEDVPGVAWPMAERFDTETTFATLTLNHRYDSCGGFVKAYWNGTDFDLRQELSNGVPYAGGGVSSLQEIALYGVRAKEKMGLWEGGELIVGADLDRADLTNTQRTNSGEVVPGVNGGRAVRVWNFPEITLLSPYAALSQMMGRSPGFHVIPSAGFRYYAHNEFENAFSPQAGIVVGWNETDFAFNYARGANYPSPAVLQALVIDSSTVEDPGQYWSAIRPEVVDHFEISLTHNLPGRASMGVTLFRDEGRDRFRAYMFGPIPAQWNDPIGEYRIDGLEVTAVLTPLQNLDLFAGATWLDSEATGYDGLATSRLPYTPSFQLQAGADWRFYEKYRLHADFQHLHGVFSSTSFRTQGFSFADLNENLRLDDSALVNLRLSRSFDWTAWGMKNSEIYIAVNNLFDDCYQYATGYDMPGIHFIGGLKVRFQ